MGSVINCRMTSAVRLSQEMKEKEYAILLHLSRGFLISRDVFRDLDWKNKDEAEGCISVGSLPPHSLGLSDAPSQVDVSNDSCSLLKMMSPGQSWWSP